MRSRSRYSRATRPIERPGGATASRWRGLRPGPDHRRAHPHLDPAGLSWISALRAPAIDAGPGRPPATVALRPDRDSRSCRRGVPEPASGGGTSARSFSRAQARCGDKKNLLRGKDAIAVRADRALGASASTSRSRSKRRIPPNRDREEAALDGFYASAPTSPANCRRRCGPPTRVSCLRSYKSAPQSGPAPSPGLDAVFLCARTSIMRRTLAPLLFDDQRRDDPRVARRSRAKVALAMTKDSRRTADGLPVHSFQTLLADLAMTRNRVRCTARPAPPPTSAEAFKLLASAPEADVPSTRHRRTTPTTTRFHDLKLRTSG